MNGVALRQHAPIWSDDTERLRKVMLSAIGDKLQLIYGESLVGDLPESISKLLVQLDDRTGGGHHRSSATSDAATRIALVVEKDDEARHLATALLEETELEVAETAEASEAYRFLSTNAPQVVLVLADGETASEAAPAEGGLAKVVAHRWPWIRVVLLTDGPTEQGFELPAAVTLLPKPWRALDVLVEADRALRTDLTRPSEEAARLWG